MKTFLRLLVPVSTFLLAATVTAADSTAMPRKKILFFSKSSGFEHAVISYARGRPSFVEQVLSGLGADQNIEFTFSKDGSRFSPEYLAQFDAFLFYTTGDLTERHDELNRGDENPPMTAAGKTALLEAIRSGKGFIGVHSADDTFHASGDDETGPRRHSPDGARADPYIKMLGGEFIEHGAQQKARLLVADSKFPGAGSVPAVFGPMEEWYAHKNFAPDLHVILVLDPAGMTGPVYARPPFPVTWARQEGKGRVFYTSMGHREDVWTNPVFQALRIGGLNWASGRVEADVTPNITQVAPQANALPAFPYPRAAGKR